MFHKLFNIGSALNRLKTAVSRIENCAFSYVRKHTTRHSFLARHFKFAFRSKQRNLSLFFPGAVEYEVYSKLEEEDELDFTRTTNRSVVMVRGLSSGSTYQFAIKTIAESKKTSEFSDLYTITTRQ